MLNENELQNIRGDRKLVEELYSEGEITTEARDNALDFITPPKRWGVWVSHFSLVLGTALLLSGIVYFFAFNWTKITPFVKFTSIQLGIVISIAGAYYYSLKKVGGQVFLLAASVLIGVFMAVYGQIYQTGADAYQLFMMWSLAILGWTIISKFAAQWVLWLIVTNTFIILWCRQIGMSNYDTIYLAIMNGTALALFEYLSKKESYEWLNARWLRVLLVVMTLYTLSIPIYSFINHQNTDASLIISTIIGVFGHGLILWFYRYKKPDITSLVLLVLSVCIILEFLIFEYIGDSIGVLIGGLLTLAVFTLATQYLLRVSKKIKAKNE